MSYYKRPVLLMFLGIPGSGKSYFAKAIADKMNAIRINGDSMRIALFGSREEIDRIYTPETRETLNGYVFEGLDYMAEQVLIRGQDIVYDAHHNKKSIRDDLQRLADKHNAQALLVWVKTSTAVAIRRALSREESADQRKYSKEKLLEVIRRHNAVTDEPKGSEAVIIVDGEQSFKDQFQSFEKQLEELLH